MKKMKKMLVALLTLFLVCIPFSQASTKVEAAGIPALYYRAHVEGVGWQRYVKDGNVAGTVDKGQYISGLSITTTILPVPGDVTYKAYVENIGWQNLKAANQIAGKPEQKLRIEAFQVKLTGEIRTKYDIYYRTYVQNYGWLGWTKNGSTAGSAGQSLRMEAFEVKLVKKGDPAPEVGKAFIG